MYGVITRTILHCGSVIQNGCNKGYIQHNATVCYPSGKTVTVSCVQC